MLIVILLPSLTAAQDAAVRQNNPPPSAEQSQRLAQEWRAHQPPYSSYTLYHQVRRGTSEDVAVLVQSRDQNGYFTTPNSPVAGIVPLNLQLEAAPGFTVTHLRYPKARKQRVKFQQAKFPIAGSKILVKLDADRTVELGSHVLNGKLSFESIDEVSGKRTIHQIDIEIPITVVEHDAKVQKTGDGPFYHMPASTMIMLIVLIPILLPLMLLCEIASGGNCSD